jgi:type VI secretion system secreted protein VgrG
MGQYTQDNRPMRITTPLGKDVLLLAGFDGVEAISRLFRFEIELLSENHSIAFGDIIGKQVSISSKLIGGSDRYFHGIISRFSHYAGKGGTALRLSRYRATMVPWTWLLTRTADSRIFQNMSVPEIIEKVFREKAFSNFSIEAQEPHEKRVYCVQYRETDFNFISRLMEDEGIYYYFTHNQNTHTMVIADTPGKHKKLSGKVRYQKSFGGPVGEDTIIELDKVQEIQAGKYSLSDFNFEIPKMRLEANVDSQQKLGPGEREMYDYPGGYTVKASGERLTRIRMEEEESRITTITGSGNCREFCSGYRFTLSDTVRSDMNDKDYVLTSVEHHAVQGWEGESEISYTNAFSCIPYSVPFRTPLVTVKPFVHGSQTATVVGPKGEEIYTDKYGRVKVWFHWDREAKGDEQSSCWVRVSSGFAGGNYGSIFIPRIGQEVIVDFLEGDPDQPIITGRVYNADNMPPYALPDEKTKSTIKTNSSTGGDGFNEIRFEDKKGKEQLFIHAEKQQDNRVKEDSLEWIGKDRHLIVKGDQMESVEGDKHLQVKGDQDEKVAGTVSLKADMDIQRKAAMKYALDAGTEIHLKSGMNLVVESGTTLTLKVGGNFININPGGIFIKGTMVMINSGGAAGSGSGASPAPPKDPLEADTAKAGKQEAPPSASPRSTSASSGSANASSPSPASANPTPQAQAFREAAASGRPFCEV